MSSPVWLNAEQAAEKFNVRPRFFRDRFSKQPGFPTALPIGRELRWRADELDQWAELARQRERGRERRKHQSVRPRKSESANG